MRSNTTQQNIWAQLSISACALLLPPMALGAAVLSMLPARDEGAGRAASNAAAEAHATTPRFRIEAGWPVSGDSQPVAEVTSSGAATAVALGGRNSASSAEAHRELAGKKDAARMLGPVPVRVTIVTPLATTNPPPSVDVDNTATGSVATMPWPSAASEVSTALLPRIPPAPAQVLAPQVLPPQTFASAAPAYQAPASATPATQASVQVPAADRPAAESPAASASTLRKRVRQNYLRTLATPSGARAEARSEARAVRRNAQPQPQQTFSFKNWLEQLGTHPRNTGS
jgi:hypothetical protein